MGFGEYLDQIIRSHLTVAESTELTIKVSYFLIASRGSLLCAPRTTPPIDSHVNTFVYKTISILFFTNWFKLSSSWVGLDSNQRSKIATVLQTARFEPLAYLPILDRVDFHATKFRLKVTSSITGDHNHFLLCRRGFHLLYLRREYTAITRSMENRTPDTAVKGRWLNHLPILRFLWTLWLFW